MIIAKGKEQSAQWARFPKNLQQLIIFYSKHFFFQTEFRAIVKFDEKSESGEKNLKKIFFRAQIFEIGYFLKMSKKCYLDQKLLKIDFFSKKESDTRLFIFFYRN